MAQKFTLFQNQKTLKKNMSFDGKTNTSSDTFELIGITLEKILI